MREHVFIDQVMIRFIRRHWVGRLVSGFLAVVMLVTPLMGLSSGPTTPEAAGFSKLEPGEDVNLYTGDFSYTIPLFEVGGYPFNLTYSSDVTMEQEASWVGLGWNLDIGAIDRQVRGLPDDFRGDKVVQEDNIRPDMTVQFGLGISGEVIGREVPVNAMLNIGFNNYTGLIWGFQGGLSHGGSAQLKNTLFGWQMSVGLSMGSSGFTLAPQIGLEFQRENAEILRGGGLGFGFNKHSRLGVQSLDYSWNLRVPVVSSVGRSMSYQLLSFSPPYSLRFENISGKLTVKGLAEVFWSGVGGTVMGSFSRQELKTKVQELSGYGYLYMANRKYGGDELMDVHREKDVAYMPGIPSLPQPHVQPDMFRVHTNALGGVYRAFKNRAQLMGEQEFQASKGRDLTIDVEIGGGNAFKIGVNPTYTPSRSEKRYWDWMWGISQGWLLGNANSWDNGFVDVYFRRADGDGEGLGSYYLTKIGGEKEVLPNDRLFESKYSKPPAQSTAFIPITRGMIEKHPLYGSLYSRYYLGVPAKPHHVTHIEITDEGGSRYVFGCPAYHHEEKEVSFNVSGSGGWNGDDLSTYTQSLVGYEQDDASRNNRRGYNHYFHAQTLPPYVYAYHLTEIYSPDYADLRGDGPTVDDAGEYVLFHYQKKIADYKWRTPMSREVRRAKFNPGYISRADDNMGFYSYGRKDIWYVDTIRSKYEIAIFYTSPRRDGKEVAGEHGGIDNNSRSLHKLDSIYVYDLEDFRGQGGLAKPKKRIRFWYDYSLCRGVPNSDDGQVGKLTLRRLEIIEGSTYQAKRSNYRFHYSSINPSYSVDHIDRWGGYKNPDALKGLYPYAVQDSAAADSAAQAWRLIGIELPGGGAIEVSYEADRYAYVQDKKATRMFKLVGVSDSHNSIGNSGVSEINEGKWLIFETDIPAFSSNSDIDAEFQKYFSGDVRQLLYFKAKMKVNRSPALYEYVNGFASVENTNWFRSGNRVYGAIKLQSVRPKRNEPELHPFQVAAMQLVLTAFPNYYQERAPYNGPDDVEGFVRYVANELGRIPQQIYNQMVAMIKGPFDYMNRVGIGSHIVPGESWIRLAVREHKYASSSRVRQIVYLNRWAERTSEAGGDIAYIKRYEYVTEDGKCSGVAAYEPIVGADENPVRIAQAYTNVGGQTLADQILRALAPKIEYLYYYPHNEFDYPAPTIGYSRVVVRNIVPAGYKSTGWTVHEFYTDKDYPVRTNFTPLSSFLQRQKIPPIDMPILPNVSIYRIHAAASQGFCTILTNMPGQKKAISTFDGDSNLIRRHEYVYSLPSLYPRSNSLLSLNPNDTVYPALPRVETEVVLDLREQTSESESYNVQLNLDVSILPFIIPIPVPIPGGWPKVVLSRTIYQSAVVNKTIYKYASLVEEKVTERGANLSVSYLAFDPVTHRALIRGVLDKFGRHTYTYELPAYHVYPQLGPASPTEGLRLTLSTDTTGRITSTHSSYLSDGTQLLSLQDGTFYWVYQVSMPASSLYLIDRDGQRVSNRSGMSMVIWRSGQRNRLSETVESIEMKRNPLPLTGPGPLTITQDNQILDASATTYVDWYSFTSDGSCPQCSDRSCGGDRIGRVPIYTSYLFSCDRGLQPLGPLSRPPCGWWDSIAVAVWINESCIPCEASIEVAVNHRGIIYLDTALQGPQRFCDTLPPPNTHRVVLQNVCPGTYPFLICVPDRSTSFYIYVEVGTGQRPYSSSQSIIRNPYLYRLRNAWRPYQSYIYLTGRLPEALSDSLRLPEQSHYRNFSRFWTYGSGGWTPNPSPWKLVHTITYADLHGHPIEMQDVVGVYSTAWYTYYRSLQEGIAYNARSEEVGFDGFEYYFLPDTLPPRRFVAEEFVIPRASSSVILLPLPHTGFYAAGLVLGGKLTYRTCITPRAFKSQVVPYSDPPPYTVSPTLFSDRWAPFDTLRPFLLSFWAKSIHASSLVDNTTRPSVSVSVQVGSSSAQVTKVYESPPIEGWRQYRYRIQWGSTPPPPYSEVRLEIQNASSDGSKVLLIDDVRIQPEDAEARLFVYHPYRKQLLAILDENHFAARYLYNAQDQLEKIVKETEGGDVYVLYKKVLKSEK